MSNAAWMTAENPQNLNRIYNLAKLVGETFPETARKLIAETNFSGDCYRDPQFRGSQLHKDARHAADCYQANCREYFQFLNELAALCSRQWPLLDLKWVRSNPDWRHKITDADFDWEPFLSELRQICRLAELQPTEPDESAAPFMDQVRAGSAQLAEAERPEPKVARLAIDGIEPTAKAEDFKPFSEKNGWKVGHQPTNNLVTLCDDIVHLSLKPLQSAILAHLNEPNSPLREVRVEMLKFIIERFCHQSLDFLEVDTEELRMEISASYPLSEKIEWGGIEYDCYLSALDSLCRELRERLQAGRFRNLLGDYISHSEERFEFLATKIKRELAAVFYSKQPASEEGEFDEDESCDDVHEDEVNSGEAAMAAWLKKLGRTNQKRLKALLDSGRESIAFSDLARIGFIDRDKSDYSSVRNAADSLKKELARLELFSYEISVSKADERLIFSRPDCGK